MALPCKSMADTFSISRLAHIQSASLSASNSIQAKATTSQGTPLKVSIFSGCVSLVPCLRLGLFEDSHLVERCTLQSKHPSSAQRGSLVESHLSIFEIIMSFWGHWWQMLFHWCLSTKPLSRSKARHQSPQGQQSLPPLNFPKRCISVKYWMMLVRYSMCKSDVPHHIKAMAHWWCFPSTHPLLALGFSFLQKGICFTFSKWGSICLNLIDLLKLLKPNRSIVGSRHPQDAPRCKTQTLPSKLLISENICSM